MQRLLMSLKIMQVSYAASTDVLNDKVAYPYLLRTHPSVSRIGEAIPQLLIELNRANKTDVNSYILIQSDSLWGRTGGRVSYSSFCIQTGLKISTNCNFFTIMTHLARYSI